VNGLSSQKSFPHTVNAEPMARSTMQPAARSFADDRLGMDPPFFAHEELRDFLEAATPLGRSV
jgi:hypothetical protein